MRSCVRSGRRIGAMAAMVCLFCGVAPAQEGIARISEFSGQVAIQRGEEIIRPVLAGKVVRHGLLMKRDLVETKEGTATVLFDDGSKLKMKEKTVIVISPPVAQTKTVSSSEVVERRVRIVVGRLWTFIEPKATAKTQFEVPEGICAVRGCSGTFHVGWNGNWQLGVEEGTYIPRDLRSDITWDQGPGVTVGVERVSGGMRIQNRQGSRGPIALRFARAGKYDITADAGALDIVDADGKAHALPQGQSGSYSLSGAAVKALKPGAAIVVLLRNRGKRPIGQIAGIAPFPFRATRRELWRLTVSQEGRTEEGWFAEPHYVRDTRRNVHASNTRAQRSSSDRGRTGGATTGGCP